MGDLGVVRRHRPLAQIATGELDLSMAVTDPAVFFPELGLAFAAVFGLATIVYKAKFDRPGS